jgi:hypothetical protein
LEFVATFVGPPAGVLPPAPPAVLVLASDPGVVGPDVESLPVPPAGLPPLPPGDVGPDGGLAPAPPAVLVLASDPGVVGPDVEAPPVPSAVLPPPGPLFVPAGPACHCCFGPPPPAGTLFRATDVDDVCCAVSQSFLVMQLANLTALGAV